MRNIAEDPEKAKSLLNMADKIRQRIQQTDTEQFPSQTLTDHYNALHNLMEGLAALNGVKSSGKGAHKQLIDWTTNHLDLSQQHRQFLHQLRKHRNRIKYEGFTIQPSYLNRNHEQLTSLYHHLHDNVTEQLP